MNSIVKVQLRRAYGQERIYPCNQVARDLVELTGRKTFLPEDLPIIKRLGFTVEWVPELISVDSVEDCN